MKELSIEEKAKAYDNLIERLKDFRFEYRFSAFGDVVEEHFPELKESEDESIRKKVIEYIEAFVPYDDKDDIIAWLKKQGKNNMGISEATKQKLEDNLNNALEKETPESCNEFLEKHGGQKSTFRIDNSVAKVVFPFKARVKSTGIVVTIHGGQLSVDGKEWIKYQSDKEDGYSVYEPEDLEPVRNVESKYAWSHEDETKLIIAQTFIRNTSLIGNDGIKEATIDWLNGLKNRVQPQPKQANYGFEVGDTITDGTSTFKIVGIENEHYITDDGDRVCFYVAHRYYTTIEHWETQRPPAKWSEEDKIMLEELLDYCDTSIQYHGIKDQYGIKWKERKEWLKSLRPQNGYNPYKEVVESIAEMCKHYDKASHSGLRDFYDNVKVKCKDAKEYDSLYPQSTWKPSETEIKVLEDVIDSRVNPINYHATLHGILERLKKLKGE